MPTAPLRPPIHDDQPLGLTVHAMPRGAATDAMNNTASGRWKMFVILLVCAAPVLASYFTYYVIRPEGRRNFGELIDPQRPLPAFSGLDAEGQSVPLAALKGQWLLLSVAGGACDAACQQRLYFQRQLRESLGKEKDRLDWVWLVNDKVATPEAIQPALKDVTRLQITASDLAQWLAPATGRQLSDHLYVVDPMGNWMMRFPAAMDAEGAAQAKRDLTQLLRASAGWDQAGRQGALAPKL